MNCVPGEYLFVCFTLERLQAVANAVSPLLFKLTFLSTDQGFENFTVKFRDLYGLN